MKQAQQVDRRMKRNIPQQIESESMVAGQEHGSSPVATIGAHKCLEGMQVVVAASAELQNSAAADM